MAEEPFERQYWDTLKEVACSNCGAELTYEPGTEHLKCKYCGTENIIVEENEMTLVEETPLLEYLHDKLYQPDEQLEVFTVTCQNCHAETTFEPNVSSGFCPFCDTPLVVKDSSTQKIHKPSYLLPFSLNEKKARDSYKAWLSKLFWAPNDLKKYAENDHFQGIYLPYYTFDCKTSTDYTGERGDNYQEQRTVTVNVNGKPTQQVQTVTKTRWSYASGTVYDLFDDILVVGSQNLDIQKLQQINTWDLGELKAYNEKYLSGFKTEVFKLKLEEGYEQAKEKMKAQINSSIRRDIGGDHQRISQANSAYTDATFKEILLPIWLSSYRYRGKVYQILVNARTGKVSGNSPVSKIKVAIAILLGIAVIAMLIFFTR